MLLIRVGFAAYLLILTVLLLVPNPNQVTGVDSLPPPFDEHLTHFLLLAGLAVLAHASRPPVGSRVLIALLMVYAVGMEALQSLSPQRDVEIKDFVENVLGVAAGSAAWWLALKHWIPGRRE